MKPYDNYCDNIPEDPHCFLDLLQESTIEII